jgi:putative transposase
LSTTSNNRGKGIKKESPCRDLYDELPIYRVINPRQQSADGVPQGGRLPGFLDAFTDLKERKPFDLFGYCLLNNHFHLLLRPLETSISRIVQSLLVSHTQRYHKHYHSSNHVWQGRFKSPTVQDDEHVLTVLRYIEANPLRAGITSDAGDFRWSSYGVHGIGETSDLMNPATSLLV